MTPPDPDQTNPGPPESSRFVTNGPPGEPDAAASTFVTGPGRVPGGPPDAPESSFMDTTGGAAPASGFVMPDAPGSVFLGGPPPPPAAPGSRPAVLPVGEVVDLKGRPYTVLGVISTGTGEATIYQVADAAGQVRVLKLYYAFTNPKEEPSAATLGRIMAIESPYVLKLHDFGTGPDKFRGQYCYEINEFAEGGDLLSVPDFRATYTPAFVAGTVAPALLQGIGVLHAHHIYHCDLKPSNVFFRDAARTQVCVGDYGSAQASEVQRDDNVSVIKSFKMTAQYTAVELKQKGGLSEKVDYYAAGMILLHLAYPQHFAEDGQFGRVDADKYDIIVKNQLDERPVLPFEAAHERLNPLIAGLTRYFHRTRWGRPQVQQWLQGMKVIETGSTSRAVNLGYVSIGSERDLLDYIEKDPRWHADLVQDRITYESLLAWVQERQHAGARKTLDYIVQQTRPLGEAYLRTALLRFFDPNRPVEVEGRAFPLFQTAPAHLAGGVAGTAVGLLAALDDAWGRQPGWDGAFTLFELEFCLLQLRYETPGQPHAALDEVLHRLYTAAGVPADSSQTFDLRLPGVFANKKKNTLARYLAIFYAFAPGRTLRTHENASLSTPAEVGLYFARHADQFQNPAMAEERKAFFVRQDQARLADLNRAELLFDLFRNQVTTHIDVMGVQLSSHRQYTVSYGFRKSLLDYLRAQGAVAGHEAQLEQVDNDTLVLPPQQGLFPTKKEAFDVFLASVREKQNVGPETITTAVAQAAGAQFEKKAAMPGLRLETAEVLAALALLLPVLPWLLSGGGGQSVYEAVFYHSGLREYTAASELHRHATGGFHFFSGVGGAVVVLAVLANWLFRLHHPDSRSLLPAAAGTALVLAALPWMFALGNWQFVFWAFATYLVVAALAAATVRMVHSVGNPAKAGRPRSRLGTWVAAGVGLGLAALGTGKLSYWEQPPADSGGIWDFYLFMALLAAGLYVPVACAFLRSYSLPSFAAKLAAGGLLALAVVFVASPTVRVPAVSVLAAVGGARNGYEPVISVPAANVRRRPSADAAVIGKLYYGTPVTITDSVSAGGADWYVVRLDGRRGYLSRRLVQWRPGVAP